MACRLAPEYVFPTPIEDCYTALKWVRNYTPPSISVAKPHGFPQVAENAGSLNIDLKKGFLVGGDSGGGNISAALSLRARDDPFFASRPLTGQYLREPAVAYPGAHLDKHKAEIRSFDAFTDTPLLNRDMAVRYFSTSSPVPLYPGSR